MDFDRWRYVLLPRLRSLFRSSSVDSELDEELQYHVERQIEPFTVVGVTPASFTGLEVGQTFDIALPVCAAALLDSRIDQRDRWWLTIMGRLRPDRTIARANEHMRTLSPSLLEATIPPGYDAGLVDGYRGLRFGVSPAGRGVSRLRDTKGTSLTLLLGLTGLVLLITCGISLRSCSRARAPASARSPCGRPGRIAGATRVADVDRRPARGRWRRGARGPGGPRVSADPREAARYFDNARYPEPRDRLAADHVRRRAAMLTASCLDYSRRSDCRWSIPLPPCGKGHAA